MGRRVQTAAQGGGVQGGRLVLTARRLSSHGPPQQASPLLIESPWRPGSPDPLESLSPTDVEAAVRRWCLRTVPGGECTAEMFSQLVAGLQTTADNQRGKRALYTLSREPDAFTPIGDPVLDGVTLFKYSFGVGSALPELDVVGGASPHEQVSAYAAAHPETYDQDWHSIVGHLVNGSRNLVTSVRRGRAKPALPPYHHHHPPTRPPPPPPLQPDYSRLVWRHGKERRELEAARRKRRRQLASLALAAAAAAAIYYGLVWQAGSALFVVLRAALTTDRGPSQPKARGSKALGLRLLKPAPRFAEGQLGAGANQEQPGAGANPQESGVEVEHDTTQKGKTGGKRGKGKGKGRR